MESVVLEVRPVFFDYEGPVFCVFLFGGACPVFCDMNIPFSVLLVNIPFSVTGEYPIFYYW